MGCSQSKIENEEAVSRCKERKIFMKSAVVSRNAFAAAHSSYSMSLKNAGAALSGFSVGESLISYSSLSSTSPLPDVGAVPVAMPAQPPHPIQTLHPPPPLPDMPSDIRPPPLQRAVTMPEFAVSDAKLAHGETIEEEDEDEDEDEDDAAEEELNYRRRRREGKGGSVGGRIEHSHVMEDVSPPTPLPPVEVERHSRANVSSNVPPPPPPPPMPENSATWDYFFNVDNMTGGSLQDMEEEMPRRTVYRMVAPAPAATTVVMEDGAVDMEVERPRLSTGGGGRMVRKGKAVAGASANGGGGNGEGKRRGVSMVQLFSELDDCFLKAYESAHDVSKMLEATRLHYHSNFADSRGHIDHSARVMRVITWNRSFRGLPNAEEFKDDFDTEESETHAGVLDKLLAWEKKLYDEVKAGEIMKFDYQRKVALLNKQKKRGTHSESLEKTKAAVSHLHTRYIVDMQSMDSTVSEINRLRDEQLYPKLVALVDGMAIMWDVMRGLHEKQLKLSAALRYVDISQSVKETTEQHHLQTEQLWAVFQEWHTQFDRMVTQQKEYIRALNSWLKLNLIPIESSLKEKVSSPPRVQKPLIQDLLLAWHDLLEKLPDEHAKSAICNFAAVLQTIGQQQDEELRLKAKMEESRRDLEKKQRHFNRWLNEYLQKKMPSDETDPNSFEDGVHKDEIMVDKEFVVENAKKKLEEDTEFWQRQCVHVREKTLASFKTRLPELFRALSDFALASSDMYSNLRDISRSQSHKH